MNPIDIIPRCAGFLLSELDSEIQADGSSGDNASGGSKDKTRDRDGMKKVIMELMRQNQARSRALFILKCDFRIAAFMSVAIPQIFTEPETFSQRF